MDDVSLLKVGLTEDEKKIFDKKKIEFNKRVGSFLKVSRADALLIDGESLSKIFWMDVLQFLI